MQFVVYSGLERVCVESLGGVGYCENLEDGGVMNNRSSARTFCGE